MRSDRLLLQDILDSINTVIQFLPSDRQRFDADAPLQSHILRHLQIVGEASWRLSQEIKAQHPQVPWKKIAGMRHILVHDYFRVDWEVVYSTAKDSVPSLKPQIESILRTVPS